MEWQAPITHLRALMVLFRKLAPIRPLAAVQVAAMLADQVQGQQVLAAGQVAAAAVQLGLGSVVLGLRIKETLVVTPLVQVSSAAAVAAPVQQVLTVHQGQVQVPEARV